MSGLPPIRSLLSPHTIRSESRRKCARTRIQALWQFMVQAFADESSLAPYKSRLGKVIRDRMVRFYAASSLTNPTTLKSYFRGPTRRFTWNQVLQAVGRLPASSPRLYEVACNSPEYAELEATIVHGPADDDDGEDDDGDGAADDDGAGAGEAPASSREGDAAPAPRRPAPRRPRPPATAPARPRPAHVKATQPPRRRRRGAARGGPRPVWGADSFSFSDD